MLPDLLLIAPSSQLISDGGLGQPSHSLLQDLVTVPHLPKAPQDRSGGTKRCLRRARVCGEAAAARPSVCSAAPHLR